MITSFRTAYKIGFSDSLDRDAWSAYKDILKWGIDMRNLRRSYYRGWLDGYRIKCEVKKDLLSRHLVHRSDTGGDGTVEMENTI